MSSWWGLSYKLAPTNFTVWINVPLIPIQFDDMTISDKRYETLVNWVAVKHILTEYYGGHCQLHKTEHS